MMMQKQRIGAGINKTVLDEIMRASNISLVTTTHGTSGIKACASNRVGNVVLGGAGGKLSQSSNYAFSFTAAATNPVNVSSTVSCAKFSTVTAGLVVAATEAGEIVVSTDYGANYVLLANPFGGSSINAIDCDANGVFHFVADSGKYAKTTDATATAMSALIDVGSGSVILDNIVCITGGIVMISGHSARLRRSTANGDAGSWSGITNPYSVTDLDALWCIAWDGGTRVVIGCYESNVANKRGTISISNDLGLTFGSLVNTAFTTIPQRMIRFKKIGSLWFGVGDAGTIQISQDLNTFKLIKANPFLGGIIYDARDIGQGAVMMPGATGRVGRTLFYQG